jgi:hypothetical protein
LPVEPRVNRICLVVGGHARPDLPQITCAAAGQSCAIRSRSCPQGSVTTTWKPVPSASRVRPRGRRPRASQKTSPAPSRGTSSSVYLLFQDSNCSTFNHSLSHVPMAPRAGRPLCRLRRGQPMIGHALLVRP